MKKLIILGAGASVDFGFPSGVDLLKEIYGLWIKPEGRYLHLYLHILNRIRPKDTIAQDIAKDRIQSLASRLFYSGAESIDDFLSQCTDKAEVYFGKVTILNLILEKESASDNANQPKALFRWDENWLRKFFGSEFRRDSIDLLKKKFEQVQVGIITFNYDRNVEHFLYHALKFYYDLPSRDVVALMQNIKIEHVYGEIAPLGWHEGDPNKMLRYGDNFSAFPYNKEDKILNCAISNIRVINEDREKDLESRQKSQALITEADRVHILGFGFLGSNLDVLGFNEYKKNLGGRSVPRSKFYYTSHGLSEGLREHIVSNYFGRLASDTPAGMAADRKIYDYFLHHY